MKHERNQSIISAIDSTRLYTNFRGSIITSCTTNRPAALLRTQNHSAATPISGLRSICVFAWHWAFLFPAPAVKNVWHCSSKMCCGSPGNLLETMVFTKYMTLSLPSKKDQQGACQLQFAIVEAWDRKSCSEK